MAEQKNQFRLGRNSLHVGNFRFAADGIARRDLPNHTGWGGEGKEHAIPIVVMVYAMIEGGEGSLCQISSGHLLLHLGEGFGTPGVIRGPLQGQGGGEMGIRQGAIEIMQLMQRWHPNPRVPPQVVAQPAGASFLCTDTDEVRAAGLHEQSSNSKQTVVQTYSNIQAQPARRRPLLHVPSPEVFPGGGAQDARRRQRNTAKASSGRPSNRSSHLSPVGGTRAIPTNTPLPSPSRGVPST